jgi:hypothetical protein
MPGAQVSMVNIPANGVMSQPKQFVWVFTPNANFCALGGNDRLIMQVVDENGNIKVIQRNLSAMQKGDIPSVISTGFEDSAEETKLPIQSNTYPILLSWLLISIFTNLRERTLVKSLKLS